MIGAWRRGKIGREVEIGSLDSLPSWFDLHRLLGRFGKVAPKKAQLDMPRFPLLVGNVKCVPHIAQEFHFHDMNLLHRNTRNFGPSLICVRIVIKNYDRQRQFLPYPKPCYEHLFPSINATVRRRYSLPNLPFTPGLSLFNRWMNIKASKITFCVT